MNNAHPNLVLRYEGDLFPLDVEPEALERLYQEVYLPATIAYQQGRRHPVFGQHDLALEMAVVYESSSVGKKRKSKPAGEDLQLIPPAFRELWVGTLINGAAVNNLKTLSLVLSSRGRTVKITNTQIHLDAPNIELRYMRTWAPGKEKSLPHWDMVRSVQSIFYKNTHLPDTIRGAFDDLVYNIDREVKHPVKRKGSNIMPVLANILSLAKAPRFQGMPNLDPPENEHLRNEAAAAFMSFSKSDIEMISGDIDNGDHGPDTTLMDILLPDFAVLCVWLGIDQYVINHDLGGIYRATRERVVVPNTIPIRDMDLYTKVSQEVAAAQKRFA